MHRTIAAAGSHDAFTIAITEAGRTERFAGRYLTARPGDGIHVELTGGGQTIRTVIGYANRCTCGDRTRDVHGSRCRHVLGLKALQMMGKLPGYGPLKHEMVLARDNWNGD